MKSFLQKALHHVWLVYWHLIGSKRRSARVILINAGQILLVRNFSSPYWSLPGGGIDRDEEPADCAVREVAEELGIHDVEVQYQLGRYHAEQSRQKKDWVFWIFVARTNTREYTKQWEISEAAWFDPNDLPENTSGPTRRRVVEYLNKERGLEGVW